MTDYAPISKFSKHIHIPKGFSDERSISERFADTIESQAGKSAVPVDKPKRVKDPKAIAKVRAWGRCQHCEKRQNLAVHHIQTRAAGGGDVPLNLILLCDVCHRNAHQVGIPSRRQMLQAAEDRDRRQQVALSAFVAEKLVKEQSQ